MHSASSSSPTAPDALKERLVSILHFAVVLQQPQRYSKQERFRAWIQLAASVSCILLLVSWFYSFVLTWILGLLMQLAVVILTSFTLFVVMEYSDRSSDGSEVERLTRPLIEVQLWTRWVQLLHTLLIGEWWLAILLIFPQIPLDWHLMSRQLLVPDATTLWKTVKTLDWWNKVKLVYQGLLFVIYLVLMVVALISSLMGS